MATIAAVRPPSSHETVNKSSVIITLLSSPSASSYGQAVTFTAEAVTDLDPGVLTPSGTVTFNDGATPFGTAPFVPIYYWETQAALTFSGLAVGSNSITASYPGDNNYLSGTSSPTSFTVSKDSTNTSLVSSVNPSALGQSVTFTANVAAVSPASGTPTGTVSFKVNGTTVATNSLTAAWPPTRLPRWQGSSSITAAYNGDSNFDTTTSNLVNQTVNAATNWVITAGPAALDPGQGLTVTVGTGTISPVGGGVLRHLGFDPNQHVVCNCGCGCGDDNNQAGQNTPSLSYASSTVNVLPVFMVSLASDFTAAVPSQIQAQLTWNGTAQGWVTFGTTGHNSGDVYALPLQVGSAVSSSAHYPWGVEVKATVGTFVYDRTAFGRPAGAGQHCQPLRRRLGAGRHAALLIGSAGVAMIDNTTGGFRYFTGTGPSYTSPANDQGTLVQNMGGSYTYTAKDQTQTNFDSSGNMTSQVDPHGLTQTLSYSGGLLSTMTQPDGGVATLQLQRRSADRRSSSRAAAT